MAEKGWVAEFGKKDHFTREPEPGVRLEIDLRRRGFDARLYVGKVVELADHDHKHRADFENAARAAELLYHRWRRSIGRDV